MKFLVLLAVVPAIKSLTSFANDHERVKCLNTCYDFIHPCVKDHESECFKVYHKCLASKEPVTCLSSVNSIQVAKIAQCIDEKCEAAADYKRIEDDEDLK